MIGAAWVSILMAFVGIAVFQAQLSRRYPSFMEDESVHFVDEGGVGDLGFGALDADGADEQPHLVFLPGEHMFDAGADFRFGGVGSGGAFGHRLAAWLLAMDSADPALPLEPCLVGLAPIGRVGPDIGGGVVAGDYITQHSSVEARCVGDLALADEAEGPADRHAALVAEARDGDVDARLAVRQGFGLCELERPACVGVLLRRPDWLIGPDLAGLLARLDRILFRRRVALLGRSHQCGIDDLPTHGEIAAFLELETRKNL